MLVIFDYFLNYIIKWQIGDINMRIQLIRLDNNIYEIDQNSITRNNVRIMGVYSGDNLLSTDRYQMMGPRKIKILNNEDTNNNIYAKIVNINIGNKMFR